MNWAAAAAAGMILSAVYLLWAYQRVFFGAVTQDDNRALPDADRRERFVLVAMAVLILWMGIGSVSFTRRTEASARNVLMLMQRPQAYNARAGWLPLPPLPPRFQGACADVSSARRRAAPAAGDHPVRSPGILLMLVEPFLTRARRTILVSLAALGSGAGAGRHDLSGACIPATAFSGLLRIDGFSVFVHVVVEAVAFLVIIGSADYLDREHIQHGEYYALVLFATVGMGVMASAAELMTAFVGLETSSISTYILASYRRDVAALQRIGHEVFSAGLVCHGVFPLRHRAGLRRHGNHAAGA